LRVAAVGVTSAPVGTGSAAGPAGKQAQDDVVGKVGRVTGTVAPGQVGEVILTTSRGSDAFHAYASKTDDTLPVGTRVLVLEYFPPRTVVVEPL
jgi:hypothetical protein